MRKRTPVQKLKDQIRVLEAQKEGAERARKTAEQRLETEHAKTRLLQQIIWDLHERRRPS